MQAFNPDFCATLTELLTWRRDVRHFRTDPLDEALVLELLTLAQLAPSVGNSQPWRFVRVKTPALRATLADHVDAERERATSQITDATRHDAYRALKLHGLGEAPEIIAVFCDDATTAGAGLGAATMPQTRLHSVVLAIHTLWLAARARGLALGWVSILDPAFVAGTLAVPDDWTFAALLCLGHPEAVADTPELDRLGWQARLDPLAQISER